MYLVIKKTNYSNISPSFMVVNSVEDYELAKDLSNCLVREAKEKNNCDFSFDVVQFNDVDFSIVNELQGIEKELN
tara:strand:+ start:314 stop:538 length:225 start_codon:yes stop_codon:yes gene_type:complete